MEENELSTLIIAAAIEVHKTLGGPGLLESVYQEALALELVQRGLSVEREKLIPVVYKGHTLTVPFRLDILVGKLVIVECKPTIDYHPIFETQLLTYLRLTGLKLGLVINFGEKYVKNGIHRVVNGLY